MARLLRASRSSSAADSASCHSTASSPSVVLSVAAVMGRGGLLFFLNNDTVLPANTLRKLVRFFDENPHAGMIGPRLRGRDGNNQISYRRRPTLNVTDFSAVPCAPFAPASSPP